MLRFDLDLMFPTRSKRKTRNPMRRAPLFLVSFDFAAVAVFAVVVVVAVVAVVAVVGVLPVLLPAVAVVPSSQGAV